MAALEAAAAAWALRARIGDINSIDAATLLEFENGILGVLVRAEVGVVDLAEDTDGGVVGLFEAVEVGVLERAVFRLTRALLPIAGINSVAGARMVVSLCVSDLDGICLLLLCVTGF